MTFCEVSCHQEDLMLKVAADIAVVKVTILAHCDTASNHDVIKAVEG